MQYVGGFFNLLNPFALLAALTMIVLIIMHAASFLSIKTTGEIEHKAKELVRWLWLLVVLLLVIFLVTFFIVTGEWQRINFAIIFPLVAVIASLLAGYFLRKGQFGRVFITTCVTVAFVVLTIFAMLYPQVMVSSLNPLWSLTIQNAASSPYTLKLMTIVALVLLPLILLYQGWSYWVFRNRVAGEPKQLTY
jgi:cytochrome bd ubiquinol oxidase subunit II